MTALGDKSILLISPQPWDHLHVSKHHYALELARRGNTVFYLEPPLSTGRPGSINFRKVCERLNVISYRPFFDRRLRFHVLWLYELLMGYQISLLLKRLEHSIDIVWSFEFNLYPNLRKFSADKVIFQPVDPITLQSQANVARSADIVVSVSQTILDSLKSLGSCDVPTLLVGHGVCREFLELARQSNSSRCGQLKNVGYAGNLNRPHIDWATWQKLILATPQTHYHFWGCVENANENFNAIRSLPNVTYRGEVNKQQLAEQYREMDCFLLLYLKDPRQSDLSNSHKLLEYLATGRPAISVPIDYYAHHDGTLVYFVSGEDSDALVSRIQLRFDDLEACPDEFAKARKQLVLEHSYSNHIDTIAAALARQGVRHEPV